MQKKIKLVVIIVMAFILLAGIVFIFVKSDLPKKNETEKQTEETYIDTTEEKNEAIPEPDLGEGGLPTVNPFAAGGTEEATEGVTIPEAEALKKGEEDAEGETDPQKEELQPETTEPEATEPETTEPEATEPEATGDETIPKEEISDVNTGEGGTPVVNPFG